MLCFFQNLKAGIVRLNFVIIDEWKATEFSQRSTMWKRHSFWHFLFLLKTCRKFTAVTEKPHVTLNLLFAMFSWKWGHKRSSAKIHRSENGKTVEVFCRQRLMTSILFDTRIFLKKHRRTCAQQGLPKYSAFFWLYSQPHAYSMPESMWQNPERLSREQPRDNSGGSR